MILRAREDLVRQQIEAHSGREVKALGDGFMDAFGSARRAVQCSVVPSSARSTSTTMCTVTTRSPWPSRTRYWVTAPTLTESLTRSTRYRLGSDLQAYNLSRRVRFFANYATADGLRADGDDDLDQVRELEGEWLKDTPANHVRERSGRVTGGRRRSFTASPSTR